MSDYEYRKLKKSYKLLQFISIVFLIMIIICLVMLELSL